MMPDQLKKIDTMVSEITIIDVSDIMDHCEMAQLIKRLNQCNAKAIGINAVLEKETDSDCSEQLTGSIRNGTVVLFDMAESGKFIASQDEFSRVAALEGWIGLRQTADGVIDAYKRMYDEKGKWRLTGPMLLALEYNKSHRKKLGVKVRPDEFPIVYHRKLEDFRIYQYPEDSIPCAYIQGRLVLVGYMGPDKVATEKTANSTDRASQEFIVANIVLDILEDIDSTGTSGTMN